MKPISRALADYLAKRAEHFLQRYNNLNYDAATNGEFELVRRLAPHLSVAFDVGANVGLWATRCAQLGVAQVHAFEIMPETFARLAANAAPYPQISCNPFGLYDRDGDIQANRHPRASELCTLAPGGADIHGVAFEPVGVAIRTGDSYCAERGIERIDFLKIDAEGSEFQVLRGLQRMLAGGRVAVVQFEYGMVNIYTRCLLKDFYDHLGGLGYAVGKLFPGGVRFKPYRPEDEDFRGPNFVAVLESRPDLIELARER